MRKYIYIVTLFCLAAVKGQNLQDLKNEKSIFVIYDTSDHNVKKSSSSIVDGKIDSDTYYYTFLNRSKKDGCDPEKFNFWITYKSYESFNDLENNKKTPKFKVSKNFFEMNKSKIINRTFMDAIGFKKTFNLLKKMEYIYLIDKEEVENGVFTLKKANLSFSREE